MENLLQKVLDEYMDRTRSNRQQLAEKLDLTPGMISKMLHEDTNKHFRWPGRAVLHRIADITDHPYDELWKAKLAWLERRPYIMNDDDETGSLEQLQSLEQNIIRIVRKSARNAALTYDFTRGLDLKDPKLINSVALQAIERFA